MSPSLLDPPADQIIPAPSAQDAAPDCPYVGLVPFSDADANRFFGREKERRVVTDNLKASRLTLVYGASGVGKSSLLRAGVMHALNLQAAQNFSAFETPRFIVVYFNAWKENPGLALKLAIQKAVAPWLAGESLDPGSVGDGLAQFLSLCSERTSATLFVMLDQFEEYFLYHSTPGEPYPFDSELALAVNDSGIRANFLISMREDMLSLLDRLKGKIPNILSNYLRIEHLDKEAAQSAIEKPLAWYNAQPAAKGQRYSAEPALVEEVLGQVATGQVVLGDTGGGSVASAPSTSRDLRIETPFLQLVLTRLWEEESLPGSCTLRKSTLDRLGGAAEIADKYLDTALAGLSPEEQRIAAAIFYYLVTPSGLKIAQTVGDLAALAGVQREQLVPVLEKLSGKSRVLRSLDSLPGTHSDVRYQIFHDVLAPAVLAWRSKFAKNQELEEAERCAQEQRQRAEKEARGAARLRWISISLIVCLIVAAVMVVLALSQGAKAHREAQFSFARQLEAAANNSLQWDPQLSLLLTLRAISVLHGIHQDTPLPLDTRDALSQAVQASRQIYVLRRGNPHAKMLDSSFNPDGTRIVTAAEDGAEIWDAASGKPLLSLGNDGHSVIMAIYSPKGRYIATLSQEGIVSLYASSGALLGSLPEDSGVAAEYVMFTPDDNKLVVVNSRPEWELWEIDQNSPRKHQAIPLPSEFMEQFGEAIAFSPDGTRMAVAGSNGSGHVGLVFDLKSGKYALLSGHKGIIYSIAFSPDGQWLATGSSDGTARIWEASTGDEKRELKGHTNTVFHVAFDPVDLTRLATASADGTARIWDITTEKPLTILTGHKNVVYSVEFSPDGQHVITSSWDGTAILWDALRYHTGPVNSVAFSHSELASSGQDGTIRLWDPSKYPLRRLRVLSERSDNMISVAFSPDGTRLGAAGANGWAKVFDSDGHLLFPLNGSKRDINDIAFSPKGDRIVTAHDEGKIRVWDASGNLQWELQAHAGQATSAIFSPDGQLIATAGSDQVVRMWDASGHAWPSAGADRFERHFDDPVQALAFSPQGDRLAISTLAGTVEVVQPRTGQSFRLDGTTMSVTGIAFSPDGTQLATSSWDRTVRVWNLATRRTTLLFAHPRGVEAVAFSEDGRYLATGCDDGVVRLFPLNDDELLAAGRSRVTRTLTTYECRQYLHQDTCPAQP